MSNQLAAFGGIPFSPAALTPKKDRALERGYAPSLRLIATGTSKLVSEDRFGVGNYAVVDGQNKTELEDDELLVVPLAKLHKAVDFSEKDETVVAFGEETEEYQRIAGECDEGGYDSGCMYGPLYLFYLVNTSQFVEFYLNSKSAKFEEDSIDSYLPISEEIAEQYGVAARPPQLVTLSAKLVKGKRNQWYVPVVSDGPKSLDGIDPPEAEAVLKACENFVKQAEESDDTEEGGRER